MGKKANPALYSDNVETVADMPERGIIAFKRWNNEGNIVIVVANLLPIPIGEFRIPILGIQDGDWREEVYGYDVPVYRGTLIDRLSESEIKIYVKR